MSDILISKLDQLPEFLNSQDLVNLGLFVSKDTVYISRYRGDGPSYIKLKRRVLYPKSSVLAFIESHFKDGSIPRFNKSEVIGV